MKVNKGRTVFGDNQVPGLPFHLVSVLPQVLLWPSSSFRGVFYSGLPFHYGIPYNRFLD